MLSLFWAIFCGISTGCIIYLLKKYYVPLLMSRVRNKNSESELKVVDSQQIIHIHIYKGIFMILFSAVCGYSLYENSTSVSAILKMTLSLLVLVCVFVIDEILMIIPNIFSIILLFFGVIFLGIDIIIFPDIAFEWIKNSVVAGIGCVFFLFVMVKLTNGGLGMGDTKILGSLAFVCGVRAAAFTLTFSFIICAIFSVFLIFFKKKNLKESLPLGPFIYLGYGLGILLKII